MIWKRSLHRKRSEPRVPHDLRLYVVADIHGRADLLQRILIKIEDDLLCRPPKTYQSVFLGDYIDRGPQSCAVIECLIEWGNRHPSVFLKGNHEAMLNAFLIQPSMLEEWREYGGLGTLLSYGLKPSYQPRVGEEEALLQALRSAIPPSHRQFLDGLLLCYSCGDFYFVHAGVRPGRPLANQNEADLLWIRNDFLLHEEPFEKMIVHGHTPIAVPEIRSNRINIDTGAYATGTLSCLVIDGAQTQFL